MEKVKLVIGLGNPGKEYEKTYHNVGFLAIDYLVAMSLRGAKRGSNPINKKIASVAFGDLAMTPLLKSNVFMNQSGNFVKAVLKKYKIKPEEILIIHDDSDIELGKYKLCFGRGSAGHKGVQSIIDALKTKNFWRLRIGVRPQADAEQRRRKRGTTRTKASELVLKKITKHDLEILEKVFEEILNKLAHVNLCSNHY